MKLYDIYTENKDTFTDDTLYKVPYNINNVKSNSKAGLNNMFFDTTNIITLSIKNQKKPMNYIKNTL